jgi:predicted ATPase with chaperone activity
MTVLAVIRALGVPLCIFLVMLAYYEGVPVLRDIPFADRIPVVRELIAGRVPTERAKAAAAAREGYVVEARATAAEAKAAELQRQVNAGQLVISSYQEIAKNDRTRDEQMAADTETRIRDYEKLLRAAGRRCDLNADDIRMFESR